MENKSTSGGKKWFNLFDVVVIAAVLVAVAAVFLWKFNNARQPAEESSEAGTVRYVIRMTGLKDDTVPWINVGDQLQDNAKKYEIGTIVDVQTSPTKTSTKNYETGDYILSEVPGQTTAFVTVEAPCTETESTITVDGGFTVRGNTYVTVSGPGYIGSGAIVYVERG